MKVLLTEFIELGRKLLIFVSPEPGSYRIAVDGSSLFIVIPIGGHSLFDISYFAQLGFDTLPGGDRELFMNILAIDHGDGHRATVYWSGRDTEAFIVGSDRRRVRDVLAQAADVLLGVERPERIICVTYDRDPPAKALRKHEAVIDRIRRRGYRLQSREPQLGKRIWILTRKSFAEPRPVA